MSPNSRCNVFLYKFFNLLCRSIQNEEIIIYDCYTSSLSVKSYQFNEYISSTNILYLELIQPPILTFNDYDDNHFNPYKLKFFFTKLSRKTNHGLCLGEHLIDCNDSYCVHENARCNGVNECRTKFDEKSCPSQKSNGRSIYSQSFSYLLYISLILYVNTLTSLFLIITSTCSIKPTFTMIGIRLTTTYHRTTSMWNNASAADGSRADCWLLTK